MTKAVILITLVSSLPAFGGVRHLSCSDSYQSVNRTMSVQGQMTTTIQGKTLQELGLEEELGSPVPLGQKLIGPCGHDWEAYRAIYRDQQGKTYLETFLVCDSSECV